LNATLDSLKVFTLLKVDNFFLSPFDNSILNFAAVTLTLFSDNKFYEDLSNLNFGGGVSIFVLLPFKVIINVFMVKDKR
jgi:hypothetical protein